MALNPKRYFTNYFKRKKPLSILFDALFLVLIILLLVPATRKETAAFFIRWTSLPASSLDTDEQYVLSSETYEWQLYTLDGEQISLADLADQPLFINIWATWCPPCIAELPYIEDLYEQYGKQVRFLLVSNEDPEIVTAFTEKHGYQRSQFYIARYSPSDFRDRKSVV